MVIQVTDASRALVPHLAVVFGQAATELLAGLDPEGATRLAHMLERMAANLDR